MLLWRRYDRLLRQRQQLGITGSWGLASRCRCLSRTTWLGPVAAHRRAPGGAAAADRGSTAGGVSRPLPRASGERHRHRETGLGERGISSSSCSPTSWAHCASLCHPGPSIPEGELPLTAAAYPLPVHYSALAAEADAATRLRAASGFQAFLIEQRLSLLTQIELIDPATLRFLVKERPGRPGRGCSHFARVRRWRSRTCLASCPTKRRMFATSSASRRISCRRSSSRDGATSGSFTRWEATPRSSDAALSTPYLAASWSLMTRSFFTAYPTAKRCTTVASDPEEQPGALQILIDASASMRGLRQIFARGTGLGPRQRLAARRRVSLRFFDGRLSEAQPLLASHETGALLSLLSFRSSRAVATISACFPTSCANSVAQRRARAPMDARP